ncbi:unnamed protein product [Rotaria magnacalcarata]|uniref:Telomere length regulation protein TEL2 homolog n=1 Tax=Rotaria magnacalcarata TaxID=392030 RepID=A0A818W1E3_9BILA|nr:unnamed protein product [Rotaria magnacalcarata]CAF3718795.1 unnamed protein product [Rotaria magnacalcarata]
MSFERLNPILKQISSSHSYLSVQPVIEEYCFNENIHLTSIEQEKLIRLCLRKLPDWFSQTPEQIKEIKSNFHKYFLQAQSSLKQKQIIDLILNEFKLTNNDYFIFLLVDVYEKNYEKRLHELENESDIGYIIHLPDRINNICMKNIPICFQTKTYFNRLSEYIQEQLINYHYPNMLAQMDTNISCLSQLIHRAAKLGYTEYIWRPLYKNLFVKKCPNDSLWLRLAQYFLLETIDDILFYTIEHSNGKLLDLFLSDRIVHLPLLETYLTETLLFHKRLSINTVRTILSYLTMSINRTEKCFQNVFLRFLRLWSQESFIRFSSNDQHFYICQCVSICLSFNQQIQLNNDKDTIVMIILNGIRIHLESTFDYIRQRGQFIGELIIQRINLFSQPNQLRFDTYDRNNSEILILKNLSEINHSFNDRQLSDDEQEELSKKKEPVVCLSEKPISSTNTIVLHDASLDDDDDDDFESYDYSQDILQSEVEKPTYIRECLADLIATDKVSQLEAALHVLPTLIEMHRIECEEIALELVRILLNYNSTFNITNFQELQLKSLIKLNENYPLLITDYLCKQFYEKNYTINQRRLILKTIQEAAKNLSQIDQIQTKIQDELFISSEDDSDSWRSTIHERLKLKTKYKTKVELGKKTLLKENNFGNIVGHFFYPLIEFIDKPTAYLSLIDGDNDNLLLCELVACLARLCIYAQNTLSLNNMIKHFLQILKALQKHQDAGVRHAVVFAYACSLVSIGKTCYDQDLQNQFLELKQWFDYIIIKDPNTEVQKLGRSVRQILLRTLQEITDN